MGKNKNKKTLRASRLRNCHKWTELPEDATALILSRLRTTDILGSAQMVCKTWYNVCNNRLTWDTIDMRDYGFLDRNKYDLKSICLNAADRCRGNLVDVNIESFGNDDLLKYIIDSSGGMIRRLRLAQCDGITCEGLLEVASKLPLLEDLEISLCNKMITCEFVEVVGRSCPLLNSLKLNTSWCKNSRRRYNGYASAIADTMHGLHHLQIFGNILTDVGLLEILDSCPHLESLDLRHCFNLNMKGDLMRRCSEKIKRLRLPNDSIHDYEFSAKAEVVDTSYDSDHYPYRHYSRYYDYSDEEAMYDDFDDLRLN